MLETDLRQRMVKEGAKQGVWIRSVNDRFSSGRPDLRIKHPDYKHLDVELKICRVAATTIRRGAEVKTGIEPLQYIEIRDMNAAGIPAVGLIYMVDMDLFTFTLEKMFIPKQALDESWVEGKRGRPDFGLIVLKSFVFLQQRGIFFR